MKLSELERRVIRAVEKGLEPVERPFAEAAARAGVEEDELISTLADLKRRGVLRRISAVLSGEAAGRPGAVLAAWRVAPERLDEVGRALAARPFVSHCVARKAAAGWPYNLYTMLHGPDNASVKARASEAAAEVGLEDYVMMETVEELKKTPPVYDFDAPGGEER